jgi:hypothetical protein
MAISFFEVPCLRTEFSGKNKIYDIEPWDGNTYFSGVPSFTSDERVPVLGPGTNYPIGLPLEEYVELFYRTKVLQFECKYTVSLDLTFQQFEDVAIYNQNQTRSRFRSEIRSVSGPDIYLPDIYAVVDLTTEYDKEGWPDFEDDSFQCSTEVCFFPSYFFGYNSEFDLEAPGFIPFGITNPLTITIPGEYQNPAICGYEKGEMSRIYRAFYGDSAAVNDQYYGPGQVSVRAGVITSNGFAYYYDNKYWPFFFFGVGIQNLIDEGGGGYTFRPIFTNSESSIGCDVVKYENIEENATDNSTYDSILNGSLNISYNQIGSVNYKKYKIPIYGKQIEAQGSFGFQFQDRGEDQPQLVLPNPASLTNKFTNFEASIKPIRWWEYDPGDGPQYDKKNGKVIR